MEQSHPYSDPPTLARPQHKHLPSNLQRIKHLQIHDRSIPVREVLRLRPRLAMSKQFDGQQIHGIRKLLVSILAAIKLRACGETVYED
jgi:hypothetical protein